MLEISVSENLPFGYELIFSSRRCSVQLTVVQGRVKVRAPTGTPASFLQQLLYQKQDWVLKHLQSSSVNAVPGWLSRTHILVAGQQLDFSWILASKGQMMISGQSVQVQIPHRVSIQRREYYIQQQIQCYFSTLAEAFFQQQVQEQGALMSVAPTKLRIGNWQRKWGYCDSRGGVGFNWRLMQAPEWVARYVVVHELAHLLHMNHSKAFWLVVSRYYPDYPSAQAWLKQHQQQLM